MAITQNPLLRKSQLQVDTVKNLEEQIERIEEDIRRLKIEFDIYFNGGTKNAPHKTRASLEARIKRISGNQNISYSIRYRLTSITTRYNAYRELWRRRLKAKGDELY